MLYNARKDYLAFRKTYKPMIKAARRELTTPMQRSMLDAIAVTAFTAGFRAGAKHEGPLPPTKLRPWKRKVTNP